MAPQPPGSFKYDLQSITQHASPASGVYALFSPSECVYVGESDDICASLLETFFEDNPSLNNQYVTHFTCELLSPESRVARQVDRIRELGPVCNGGMGSPVCGHIRGPQRQSGREAVPLAEHHDREKASLSSPSLWIGSPRALEVTPAGQGGLRVPDPPGQARTVGGPQARGEEKAPDLSSGHLTPASRPEIPVVGEAKVLPAQEKKPATRETDVRGVPKDPLSKAALREVVEERGRSTEGQIAQLRPTPQAGSGLTERILAKIAEGEAGRKRAAPPQLPPALQADVEHVDRAVAATVGGRAHWRLAAIGGLLIVIAVASFWASFPRGKLEAARVPSPAENPAMARVPALAGKSESKALETVLPLSEEATSHESSAQESTPQAPSQVTLPPDPSSTQTLAPRPDRGKSHQGPASHARSRSVAPTEKADSQHSPEKDPTAVIDWLLKRPAATRE